MAAKLSRSVRMKFSLHLRVEQLETRCVPSAATEAHTLLVSNDPFYTNGNLWGMYGDETTPANKFGSQAGEAWAAGYVGSDNVYVAVIDEGIDFTHPDLVANIWTNPYDPLDGIDNDGNGYTDDIHGWDFFHDDNTIYDGMPGSGIDAHGTHVAGTIGASGGNALGVAGVNWNVTIISAKFLGPSGGYISDAVDAVKYVTNLKTLHPEMNIVAMNNSWGGGGYSQALQDAIVDAAKQNILFVAAAGNGSTNNDRKASYPSNYSTLAGAGYDSVIAVAAIDKNGNKPSWSNYGKKTVDLGAPGVGIVSTTPGGYSSYSGTSMATPHVTGAAALYASVNPGKTGAEIRNAILNNTETTKSMQNRTVTGGRLNIAKMLGLDAGTVAATADTSGSTGSSSSSGGQAKKRLLDPGEFLQDNDTPLFDVPREIATTPIFVTPPTTVLPVPTVTNQPQATPILIVTSRQMIGWGASTAAPTNDVDVLELMHIPAPRIEAPRPVTPPPIPAEPPIIVHGAGETKLVASLSLSEETIVRDAPQSEASGEVSGQSMSSLGLVLILGGVWSRMPEKRAQDRLDRCV